MRLDSILFYEYMGIGAIFFCVCVLFFAKKSERYTLLKVMIFAPIFGAISFILFFAYMGYAYTDEELEAILAWYVCVQFGCGS